MHNTRMSSYAKADTLMGAALAPLDSVRSAGLVIVFSLFIAACAQFTIHIGPIPITGQTFAVLLTGMLLGSRLGAAAVIAYLIEGAIGLPFFAGGGAGLVRFLGPTAGYLVAFPAAAFIVGAFAEHGWDKRYQLRSRRWRLDRPSSSLAAGRGLRFSRTRRRLRLSSSRCCLFCWAM